ncbi:MAG: hypothetical protein ACRC10_08790 [Thermoguttaceae bacterium]
MVDRAKNISNTILSSRLREIFGEMFVTISGEGRDSGQFKISLSHLESVPLTIRTPENFTDPTGKEIAFVADEQQLSGLTGFHSPDQKICHTGLTFYIFEDGQNQAQYNDQLDYKLQMSYGKPLRNGKSSGENHAPLSLVDTLKHDQEGFVELIKIDSGYASTCFDVVGQQYKYGRPHNRTILVSIDEYTTRHCREKFAPIFKDAEGNTASMRPYYNNVLLFATNINGKCPSFDNPPTWVQLSQRNNLYFTNIAQETIICSFWDALYSSGFSPDSTLYSDYPLFVNYLEEYCQSLTKIPEELRAMVRIFQHSKQNFWNDKEHKPVTGLIGWYTEILDYLREVPRFANRLKVFPLPQYGFRGDWSLGVLKGSASLQLGKEAIDLICGDNEQNLRYFAGVGLPCHLSLKDNHLPPKGNSKSVLSSYNPTGLTDQLNLYRVLQIHDKAKKRSDLPNYVYFRILIYQLVEDLALLYENEDETNMFTRLQQLPDQMRGIRGDQR